MSRSLNIDSLVRGATFAAALGLFFLLILLPLVSLNQYAVREGIGVFWDRLKNPDAVAALRLTALVALAATAVNGVIGTTMAFLLTRYRFPGRKVINALVDIPLAIPTRRRCWDVPTRLFESPGRRPPRSRRKSGVGSGATSATCKK